MKTRDFSCFMFFFIVAVFLVGIVNAGSALAGSTLPKEIAINSSAKGTQYVQAAAVAAMVEKYTPMKGFVEPTKSHVAAMPLFQENKLDFIFVSQAEMYLANRGIEYYKGVGKTPMRVVAGGTEIMFDFFTSPKTGIERIEDFKGKKIMWETKSAGVFYWAAKYVLDYYKLHGKFISIPSPRPADRAEALKAGRIDAYACSTQFQAMEILHSSVGLKMLDIPLDCAEWVNKQYPPIYHAVCPKGYNGGMVKRDVPVLAAGTALQCRLSLDDNVVYAVLKAIYDHFDEFAKSHPDLKKMTLQRAVSLNSINPYHPGAIKFYKDRGVWTPEAEKMQKRLLRELGAEK
ncbi:MAG: TAXI family TRAP transporter solute-binding subunit [Deltaproteobacteria bacterium]|nr:TAXI family TRAP transporter solute-binding subunit [Deltaproteobacteria bacterium]